MPRFAGWVLAAVFSLGLASAAHADIIVCNEYPVRIRVAFAYDESGKTPAAGWWPVNPKDCRGVDFAFKGGVIYYTADSDKYREGRKTLSYHWGNKKELFVPAKDFKVDDAAGKRRGAKASMFSQVELSSQQQAKPVAITFQFKEGGTTTTVNFK